MAAFGLNDTIGVLIRFLENSSEIIDWWHRTSSLLQKIGLLPAGAAAPMKATHTYNVEWVQASLNQIGHAQLTVDGVMGQQTADAIKSYQATRGLDPDGWAGMLTVAALERDLKRP